MNREKLKKKFDKGFMVRLYSPLKTFGERVVSVALEIPKGRVTTYGRISRAAGGGTLGARSVTAILAKAYDEGEINIPFHRIVYADGKIWVSSKYRKERMKLYKKEGIEIDSRNYIKNFYKILYEYT